MKTHTVKFQPSNIFLRRLAMKKSNVVLGLSVAALMGSFLVPTLSLAQSKTQNMPVRAQVNANCNFTTTNTMTFTGYDPSDPAGPNLDGTVDLGVRCTRGATVTIGIGPGGNAAAVAGSDRAMRIGATANVLGYDFYREPGRTTKWTDSGAGLVSFSPATNGPTTIPIFGRVPGGQDVPAGTYTDTVVVTVNY
jgi:spore coat protein U-like protein